MLILVPPKNAFFIYKVHHYHNRPRQRSLTMTTGKIDDQLDKISKTSIECLLKNGINKLSFETCCGDKFSKVSQSFVDYLNGLVNQIDHDLKSNMGDMCVDKTEECDTFFQYTHEKNLEYQNNGEDLERAAINFQIKSKIKNSYFKIPFEALIADYQTLLNSRSEASKRLNDTISDIQNYIIKSGVDTQFDFETIDLNIARDIFSFQSVDTIVKVHDHDWSDPVQDEGANQTLLLKPYAAYIYNGVNIEGDSVKSSSLDPKPLNNQGKLSIKQNSNPVKIHESRNSINFNVNTQKFYAGLVKEADALAKVKFYLETGRVDPVYLDLSNLPTKVLDKISNDNLLKTNGVFLQDTLI